MKSVDANALWLFIHIPKTAGSSFRSSLAEQLQPDTNINIDSMRGKMPRDAAFAREIDDFIAQNKKRRFAFASGHLKMPEAMRIREAADRPVQFITILREPTRRVISDYRYQRTPKHPGHEQFCETYPTIDSYVADPRSQNKMLRFLAMPGEEPEATIARLESDFAFVGLVEMYPLSMRECSRLTGTNLSAGARVNVTQQTEKNSIDLSDELSAQIRRLNALDYHLWRHFRDKLRQLRDARVVSDTSAVA